jgi:hypothetical protein
MSLSPILASQAPKVNSTTLILVLGAFATDRDSGTKSTRLRVIPSSDRRVIKKWDWFVIKFSMATKGRINISVMIELYIELREISIFDLQDRCLLLAFNSQITHKVIFGTQSRCFELNYYLCIILNIILAWKANVFITPHTLLRGSSILLASITCFI